MTIIYFADGRVELKDRNIFFRFGKRFVFFTLCERELLSSGWWTGPNIVRKRGADDRRVRTRWNTVRHQINKQTKVSTSTNRWIVLRWRRLKSERGRQIAKKTASKTPMHEGQWMSMCWMHWIALISNHSKVSIIVFYLCFRLPFIMPLNASNDNNRNGNNNRRMLLRWKNNGKHFCRQAEWWWRRRQWIPIGECHRVLLT